MNVSRENIVALAILAQLGGHRLTAMTGAKDFAYTARSLTFRLPSNFAAKGINCVRITLNGLDLYDVDFMKIRGTLPIRIVATQENIYGDALRALVSDTTGLSLSL